MKKLLFAILPLLILAIALFVACDDQSGSEEPTDTKPPVTEGAPIESQTESESVTQAPEETSSESESESESKSGCQHSLSFHSGYEPTCEYEGCGDYYYCEYCDYNTRVTIPALGHDEVQHEALAPTCTEFGWDAYVTCNRCSYSTFEELLPEHKFVDGVCSVCSCLVPSEGFIYGYGEGGLIITIGNCTDSNIVIPGTRNGSVVWGVSGFENSENITSVHISEGVVKILSGAFANCPNLKTVYIPASVEYIEAGAFEDCTSLETIIFAENSKCTLLGGGAFENCTSLTEIRIPDGVTALEDYIFANCKKLSKVEFGKNSQCIKFDACCFEYCISLESIEIPSSVVSVTGFYGCTALKSVTFGEFSSCTEFGIGAFSNCTALEYIDIPSDVTKFGMQAFYKCSSLKSITIPDKTQSINSSMFEGCTSLEEVNLPNSITLVDYSAFKGCSSLKSITLPISVEFIKNEAFSGCNSLESITLPFVGYSSTDDGNSTNDHFAFIFGATSIADSKKAVPTSLKNVTILNAGEISPSAFANCASIETISLEGSVTSIGERAFVGCSALTQISIPASVETIGSAAFSGCASLKTMVLPFVGGSAHATEPDATTLFGYIFGTDKYAGGDDIYQSPNDSSAAIAYYIPEGLTTVSILGGDIFYGAFQNVSMLEYVSIPEGIDKIDVRAFCGCSSLKSIEIPQSVKRIEEYAFTFCNFESINISAGVEYIGFYAFNNIEALKNITVDEDNANYRSINGCLYTGDGKTLINYPCGSTESVFVVPEGVETIEEYAFSYSTNLTHIELCEGLTEIKAGAFFNCYNLESIVIPKTVTTIDESAFNECHYSFKTVYFTGSAEEWEQIEILPYDNALSKVEIVFNYIPE